MLRKPLFWTLLIIWIGTSSVSRAEDESRNFEDLWIPSISMAFSAHNEKGDLTGTNDIPNQDFDIDSSRSTTLAALRIGADLLTPTFHELPLKPRFFISAGLEWAAPGNGLTVVNDNARTRDDYRDVNIQSQVNRQDDLEFSNPGGQSINTDDVTVFEGQGNRITSEQRNQSWFLSVGAAFTFPQTGFTIRVRPSLDYLGESVKTEGEFTLVTKEILVNDPSFPLRENFILHHADLRGRDTHHSLGPGLELEFINELDGNLTLSLFTQIRMLWILNNTKTSINGLATNDDGDNKVDPPAPQVPASYSFDREGFNFHGGVGIRVGWKNLAFGF